MAPLDDLYGEGTSQRFLEVLPGEPTIQETRLPVKGKKKVSVMVSWPDTSLLKVVCERKNVHYGVLLSKREGLYSELVNSLPDFFLGLGVETFTAVPEGDESREILRKRGGWDDDETTMTWKLNDNGGQ